ncbi:hybrid sensor histidine kinase/response regulator, partial [Flavobacterium circumlabens]
NTTQGNYQTAELYYKKAENLLKELNIADSAEILSYQKAMAFKANHNYPLAVKTFQRIIKKQGNGSILKAKADSYYQLGLLKNQLKQNDSAIIYFDNALEINAKSNDLAQKSKIILAIS